MLLQAVMLKKMFVRGVRLRIHSVKEALLPNDQLEVFVTPLWFHWIVALPDLLMSKVMLIELFTVVLVTFSMLGGFCSEMLKIVSLHIAPPPPSLPVVLTHDLMLK